MAPAAVSPLTAYIPHLERGELAYQFSPSTSAAVFYPRVIAPKTGAADLEWRVSKGLGTVHATTVVHPQQGEPYNVALIDVDEGFRHDEPGRGHRRRREVRIGMRVKFRVHPAGGRRTALSGVHPGGGACMNGLTRGSAAIVGAAESDHRRGRRADEPDRPDGAGHSPRAGGLRADACRTSTGCSARRRRRAPRRCRWWNISACPNAYTD